MYPKAQFMTSNDQKSNSLYFHYFFFPKFFCIFILAASRFFKEVNFWPLTAFTPEICYAGALKGLMIPPWVLFAPCLTDFTGDFSFQCTAGVQDEVAVFTGVAFVFSEVDPFSACLALSSFWCTTGFFDVPTFCFFITCVFCTLPSFSAAL